MNTALVAAIAAYGLLPGQTHQYTMFVQFDGFIPILGGQEGKARVEMDVLVQGLSPVEQRLRASSELTKAVIYFNDAKLPLELEAVQGFFPKTTVEFEPTGKVTKTDAPDISLPIKLPGLDVKRFPDISYLPVQFGTGEWKVGATWNFVRSFGGSDVTYTCTVTKLDDSTATLDVQMKQTYTVLESASLETVEKEEDAERRVTTVLDGKGTAIFNRKVGLFDLFDVKATANSDVVTLEDNSKSKRALTTQLNVKRVIPSSEKSSL